jgi:hypothetical protein
MRRFYVQQKLTKCLVGIAEMSRKKPERFSLNIIFNKKITIHDIGDNVPPKNTEPG